MEPTVYARFLSLAAPAACNSPYLPAGGLPSTPTHTTFTAQGDSFAIADDRDVFRAALGGALNPPNPPPVDSGRREINWGGGPVGLTDAGRPARLEALCE